MSFFSKKMDMLQGSLWDKMIVFAIPMAFMAFLVQSFNMVDIGVLGNYIGKEAVAAVGNNFPVVGMFIALFMGLSLGANVVIAQSIGAKKWDQANRAVHTAWLLAITIGVCITIVGQLATDPFIAVLHVPPEVSQMAEDYLRVYLLAMPGISMYNFEAAIFRSKGDTKKPLIGLGIAVILNLILDIWFVQIFENGVVGVAFATVIAITVAALVLCIQLMKAEPMLRLSFSKLSFTPSLLKEIVRIGWPAAMQGLVFSISNLLIQEGINSLGANAMAASSICVSVELVIFCIVNSFAQAGTTFVSQNFGAGNLERCEQAVWWAFKLNIVCTFMVSMAAIFFAESIVSFYSTDTIVMELCITRMWLVVFPEVFQIFIDGFAGAMRGYGFSFAPAVVTVVGICVIRLTWLYTFFAWIPTFSCLMLAYPVSWFLTGSGMVGLYIYFKRHLLVHMQRVSLERS